MDLIIGAIIAMVLIDSLERHAKGRASRGKRAHWHKPSQYIMTHQDWRD